jgi:hypothetical protein
MSALRGPLFRTRGDTFNGSRRESVDDARRYSVGLEVIDVQKYTIGSTCIENGVRSVGI